MKTKGIRIYVEGNGSHDVSFSDILNEVQNGESLHWSIQFLDGWRKVGDSKVYVCVDEINESECGLILDWADLKNFMSDLFDLQEVGVIGCKDEKLLKRYKDDRIMFETCDVSIVLIDFAYWEVFSKDKAFILRLADKFVRHVLLDSDFLKYDSSIPIMLMIEKQVPTDECWPYLLEMNKVPGLTVEQVLNKYQGFEGNDIACYQISENDPELKEEIDLFYETLSLKNYLFLYVSSFENVDPKISDLAIKVGFDVGICEEERTIYSSIFNEVLFGYYEELNAFQSVLNENFLFPDRKSAADYIKVHAEMAAQGKDVEEGVDMTIYEIWKFKAP